MENTKVKNYVIAGLICLVVALAYGIKPVQRVTNEIANRGTLRGVETCIGYSRSELLSQDAVKAACVQSFQNRLYDPNLATGQAGPKISQEKLGWGGTLENKTNGFVTTWMRIAVTIFDADGAKEEVFAETPIWIDPLGKAEFFVELPDLDRENLDGIEFCELGDEAPKSCIAWGITEVRGLSI
jgi:hypothetical protein